jgi:hypothetical protein
MENRIQAKKKNIHAASHGKNVNFFYVRMQMSLKTSQSAAEKLKKFHLQPLEQDVELEASNMRISNVLFVS